MNCGKNVRLNPTNTSSAASVAALFENMRPVIFGHQ
jgi:hypothetical protein